MRVHWTIREATDADVDALALIGAATFLETFAGILDGAAIVTHCNREHAADAYARQIESGAVAWLAECEVGNAPVGFALLGKPDLPGMRMDGTDLELKRIYALSRFHGSGIGAALMEKVVNEAINRSAKRLLLGVYAENLRAQAFYAKNGFAKIADRKFDVGGRSYDDVVLAKDV